MKNKISLKEKRVCKAYVLEQKMGMTALDGSIIIPKEYDRIIQEDDELFVAIVDNPDSGIPIDNFEGKPVIGARSALTISNLPLIWRRDVKKEISAVNIDFYSLTSKFKCNKKVLAYYYSKINKVIVLLNENYTWSIAYIDYENHEIIEDKKYINISDIKGLYDGRFMIKQNDIYKVISLQDKVEFELPEDIIDAKDYTKGLVIKDHMNEYGFVDYSGKIILNCAYNQIEPKEEYIKTTINSMESVWNYEGKAILQDCTFIVHTWINNQLFFRYRKKNDNTLYGLHSIKFGNILPPEYSRLEIDKDGTIIFCKDGEWGLAKYRENIHKVLKLIDGCSHMRFNHHGHEKYIIAEKNHKYAIYNVYGEQIRKFRYRCFIPREERYLYDYFEWL